MNNLKLKYLNKKLKLESSNIKIDNKNLFVNVKSCGICGSDLKILNFGSARVANNRVMGHEIAGKIINKKNNLVKNIILGADIFNQKGIDLALGHEIDGGFQRILKIPKSLIKNTPHVVTKKKINYDTASLSEPLACCINGFKKSNFKKNQNVIIFGAGPIGYLIAALALYHKSKKVILVDSNKKRLELGISDKKLIKLSLKEYKKKILKIIKKEEINFGFIACNSTKAQSELLNIIGKNGTINFFSGIKNKNKNVLTKLDTNLIHYKQLKIVGSHGSTKNDLKKSVDLIINKKIKIDKIITDKFKITQFQKAFKKFKSGKSLKVIIKP